MNILAFEKIGLESPQKRKDGRDSQSTHKRRRTQEKVDCEAPLPLGIDLGGYKLKLAPKALRPQLHSPALTASEFHAACKQEYEALCQRQPFTTHKMSFVEKQGRFPTSCYFSNWDKNRYTDILCDEKTRFVLQPDESESSLATTLDLFSGFDFSASPTRDHPDFFINANHIAPPQPCNTPFIATQAPLDSTCADFFEMLWNARTKVVVTLSSLVENGRVKMYQYWPQQVGSAVEFGHFAVTLDDCSALADGIQVRRLLVHNRSCGQWRSVSQIHFTGWPDCGVPENPKPLVEIYRLQTRYAEEGAKEGLTGPVVVHCSAGIGRTATYIAFVFGAQALEAAGLDESAENGLVNGCVDVEGMVERIRKQRTGSVQTWEQYALIYKALNFYLKCRSI